MKKININQTVDTLNKCCQIIALCVAGYWTFNVFEKTTAPDLKILNVSVSNNLHWMRLTDKNLCMSMLDVTVDNSSKYTVKINDVKLDAWLNNMDTPTTMPKDPWHPKLLKFIEYNADRSVNTASKPEFYSASPDILTQDFVSTYLPGQRGTGAINFLFKGVPATEVVFNVSIIGTYTVEHYFSRDEVLPFSRSMAIQDVVCGAN